jgi:hypothetical protein
LKVTAKLDAKGFTTGIRKLKSAMMTELAQETDNIGKMLIEGVKNTLDSQKGFRDISADWRNYKARHGFDTRILFQTHQMYNQISYKRNTTSVGEIGGQVGYRKGAMHRRAKPGKSMRKVMHQRSSSGAISTGWLASAHEEGKGRLPSRPFFAPTAAKYHKAIIARYQAAIRKAIGSCF